MVLNKIRTIQIFQLEKLLAKCNILPPDKNVNQYCGLTAKNIDEGAQNYTNKKPEPVKSDITKEKGVDKATETNCKAYVNSTVKPESTENHS